MKIKRIFLKNLFGTFNHDIALKDNISILHGVNGIGKTTLLKIVYECLIGNHEGLKTYNFEELLLEFENKSYLKILKNEISINYILNLNSKKFDYVYYFKSKKIQNEFLEFVQKYLEKEELNNLDELVSGLKNPKEEEEKVPNWLLNFLNEFKIYFIHTNRLNKVSEYNKVKSLDLTVLDYSNDLVKKIEEKLKKYSNVSEHLNKTFPLRVINCSCENSLLKEEIINELINLDKRREKFVKLGLLDPNDDSIIDPDEEFDLNDLKIDESDRDLFSIYIKDANKKLDVFNDLSIKIEMLKRMINSKFTGKEIFIDQKEGFIFKNLNGKILKPSDLSSGEQHEIILIYELLFNISNNSIVLIDEPELSLHVSWQQEFLKDLLEINKIKKLEIIIATHSPQIIHNHWDLTIGLGDDEEDENSFEGEFDDFKGDF